MRKEHSRSTWMKNSPHDRENIAEREDRHIKALLLSRLWASIHKLQASQSQKSFRLCLALLSWQSAFLSSPSSVTISSVLYCSLSPVYLGSLPCVVRCLKRWQQKPLTIISSLSSRLFILSTALASSIHIVQIRISLTCIPENWYSISRLLKLGSLPLPLFEARLDESSAKETVDEGLEQYIYFVDKTRCVQEAESSESVPTQSMRHSFASLSSFPLPSF